ncbi:hypothetical protein D3C77_612050 [compost metagenome]
MQHADSIFGTEHNNRDDKLIANHLECIHDLALLDRRACEQGMDLVDDQHLDVELAKHVQDLVTQCQHRVRGSIRRPQTIKKRDIQTFLIC